ncbi:UNVERIFIED_ORG: hypothetical protein LHJ69_01235 [Shinella sp. XGS7]|nr:ATP-binding protein [Shinella sp. XGS7]
MSGLLPGAAATALAGVAEALPGAGSAGRPLDTRAEAPNRSLFGRMLGGFALVLLLVWLGLMAREVYDVKVLQKRYGEADNRQWADQVRLQVELLRERPPAEISNALTRLEQLRRGGWWDTGYRAPHVLLQVWLEGRLIHQAGPHGLAEDRRPPDPSQLKNTAEWLFHEVQDPGHGILLRRWQEVPGSWHFSFHGLSYYARPLLLSIPLLLLPAWLILGRGLRPLRQIGREIEGRSASDLSPLPSSPYRELAPLVSAVNRLLARLNERIQREHEFLLDAAHELKTPLAVMQLNAEPLLDAPDPARRRVARERLLEGLHRATHTVHQLLSLARSGATAEDSQLQAQDLVALVVDRMALSSQLALARGIELELLAPERCELPLHRESMAALIDNLLDNAIKYSPPDSRVEVRIKAATAEQPARLRVADEGPGIPPELHRQVFRRFYRMPGQDQAGSGLGLAIVESAAARHQARLRLEPGLGGRGLAVSLSF